MSTEASLTHEVRIAHSSVARLRVHGKTPTPEAEVIAHQGLAVALIRRYIHQRLSELPPLTDDQRADIIIAIEAASGAGAA